LDVQSVGIHKVVDTLLAGTIRPGQKITPLPIARVYQVDMLRCPDYIPTD
jgi:hypothetical protein